MKRIISITLFLLIAAIVGYLWFAYANIYNRIGAGGLKVVDTKYIYTFNDNSAQKMTYAALGDSLTAGAGTDRYEESYPYLLAEGLATDKKVILKDYSFLGARTADLIDKKLLKTAIEDKPDMVTVLIGVNDVRENIDEKQFRANYEYIVDELIKGTDAKIYLINLPFIGSDTLYLPPYSYYFKNKTRVFNDIIKQIAEKRGLVYIDIAGPTEKIFQKDGPYYSVDSFHPSKAGYNILAQIIHDNLNR